MYEPDHHGNFGLGPRRHSGLGIASFLLSLVGAVGLIGAVGWAVYVELNHPGWIDAQNEESPTMILLGLAVIGAVGAELLSLVLGIVALWQTGRLKVLAILGVVFSGTALALFAFLFVAGTLAG